MEGARQRTRQGCITCRQKRKKCDELKPQCTRCARGKHQCIWPELPLKKGHISAMPRARSRNHASVTVEHSPAISQSYTKLHTLGGIYSTPTSSDGADPSMDIPMVYLPSVCESGAFLGFVQDPGSASIFDHLVIHEFNSQQPPSYHVDDPWDRSFDHPGLPLTLGYTPNISRLVSVPKRPYIYPQEDGDEEPESIARTRKSRYLLESLSWEPNQLLSVAMANFYIFFFTRYTFDPTKACEVLVEDLNQYSTTPHSMRHSMMSTALLLRARYDSATPPAFLIEKAEESAVIARDILHVDMQSPGTSLLVKLGGLSGLSCYYYYSGNLKEYSKILDLSGPILKQVCGSTIDIRRLTGGIMLDISFLVWSDILRAISTSVPTMLSYKCDVSRILQDNIEGRNTTSSDTGLEWITGCPDIFTMLMVQIINLRQSPTFWQYRIAQAERIEEAARAWQIWPTRTSNSVLRVQRMAAQEIWRHGVILYLYYAIHKAVPANTVVQKSVKQIIRLASTIRSGHNPDSLLPVPYFIAGTFANSPKDRHFLRRRLLEVGKEPFLRGFVATLDDLWNETDNGSEHIDWSRKQPLTFMF